jgi:REP element-mobilizing transposase RayT
MDADASHPLYRQRRLAAVHYTNPDHVFFLTIRAKAGTSPFTNQELAQEVIASLHWLREHRGIAIYAYCLMPDHLHLLMQLGGEGQSLATIIGAFKRFTTRVSWRHGCTGAVWQPRFYDHILRKSEDAERIVQYILANPVRKGLVEQAEAYPFSGCPDPM